MKVQIFNQEGKSVQILQNVTNVKICSDNRKLVTYKKKCECCENISGFIYQIPVNYTIQLFLDELDEIYIEHSI